MAQREGFLPRPGGELRHWEVAPEGEPRALVAVVHGVGEHSGRHRRLAEYLAGRGYAVLLHDLRGHGETCGLRGHVDRFAEYTEDLAALLAHRTFPGRVFVLGHSLGGLIAAAFAQDHPELLAGLVLSSPLLGLKLRTPAWKRALAESLSRVAPRVRLNSGLPPEALAHDPLVAAAYRDDPLCFGQVSLRWYTELVRQMAEARQGAERMSLPVLVLQAGADALVDPEVTRDFSARLGSVDKQLIVYEGAFHELFNEECGPQAFGAVGAWLDAHA
jgi:lysophospholipase